MRIILSLIISLAVFFSFSHPALCSDENEEASKREEALKVENAIKNVIKVIASKNPKAIAGIVIYPFSRYIPFETVSSPDQFIKIFNEVFDESFLNDISKSNISDWNKVGWRGIEFQNGNIWIDEDGHIEAINHQTKKGKIKRDYLLKLDREKLHYSLRKIKEPLLAFTTKDYIIRIDYTNNDKIRYASWDISKKNDR